MSDTAPDPDGIVVGVDVGGSKVALMATDIRTGEDLARDRFPTPAEDGPAVMLEQLFEAISRLVEAADRQPDELHAVGLAVPGYVDAEHGRVIRAGNLDGWRDVPLRDIVHQRLSVPAFVDNDANAAALGEKWHGAAKQMHNFVFLALGTGAGAGVVINGRLHRGFHNSAGEVGNFLMGRKYLGKERHGHGNLELLIGGPAIRSEGRKASRRRLKTEQIFEQADGNKNLARVADRVADYVAMTVINIAALLDPEAIVIGGGTSAAGEPLLERVRERVDRELAVCPALLFSALDEDAQLHGAVFGALWQLHPDLALREELR